MDVGRITTGAYKWTLLGLKVVPIDRRCPDQNWSLYVGVVRIVTEAL